MPLQAASEVCQWGALLLPASLVALVFSEVAVCCVLCCVVCGTGSDGLSQKWKGSVWPFSQRASKNRVSNSFCPRGADVP